VIAEVAEAAAETEVKPGASVDYHASEEAEAANTRSRMHARRARLLAKDAEAGSGHRCCPTSTTTRDSRIAVRRGQLAPGTRSHEKRGYPWKKPKRSAQGLHNNKAGGRGPEGPARNG
jgi:hypothetical protein